MKLSIYLVLVLTLNTLNFKNYNQTYNISQYLHFANYIHVQVLLFIAFVFYYFYF